MATEKKAPIILKASDDGSYTVERAVAEKSGLIRTMIDGEYPRSSGSLVPGQGIVVRDVV
jgi:hypothetical protein